EEDGLEDSPHATLVERQNRDARPDEVTDEIRLEIRERQDQVRLQSEDLVRPESREAADLRPPPSLWWPVRGTRNPDHARPRSEGEHDLRRLGREAYDPLRKGRRRR